MGAVLIDFLMEISHYTSLLLLGNNCLVTAVETAVNLVTNITFLRLSAFSLALENPQPRTVQVAAC